MANQCIQQHGDNAVIHAAQRADALLAEGDMEGRAVWLRIVEAIAELQKQSPEGTVH